MGHLGEQIVTVLTAIIGVAILAVLVSQKAQTSSVITSAGAAFANDLSAAEAPVTGSTATINTSGSNSLLPSLGNPVSSTNF
jgi:hypothetical protein